MIEEIKRRFRTDKQNKAHEFIQATKKMQKDKSYVNLLLNEKFRDTHKGERCFVIGNGPSLNNENLSVLKDEYTFTVNNLFLKEDFGNIRTTYHLFSDPKFIPQIEKTLLDLKRDCMPQAIFLESSFYGKVMEGSPIYYYYNGVEVEHLKYMTLDLLKPLPFFCTVVQTAIAVALYMGFERIYLLGCDCTGIYNNIQGRQGKKITYYAFKVPEEVNERIKNSIPISCEHLFFEWYHIFKSYRLIKEYSEKKNVKIIDLTQDGILDVFPKDSLVRIQGKGENETND